MNKFYITFSLFFIFLFQAFAQKTPVDSLDGFDYKHAWEHTKSQPNDAAKKAFFEEIKRGWIKRKFSLIKPPTSVNSNFNYNAKLPTTPSSVMQGPQPASCNNIDFESGNLSGWTSVGSVNVTSGGTDPNCGFPQVYPGGNYSARISGDWSMLPTSCICGSSCSSQLSRVISVSAANAQLALHYAMVVFNYPHTPADAANIEVTILNSAGVQIACPYFKVYYSNGAFTGITGISSSTGGMVSGCTGNYNTTYIPWQNVNIDLSAYIGSSVTLKVTVNWCAYNCDWAYAYIDADCLSTINNLPPVCMGSPACAPTGFTTYNWSIPGGGSSSSQCISPAVPGVYTVVCQPSYTCSSSKTLTMSIGNTYSTSVSGTNVKCNGNSNGSATVSATGSPGPYTYTWLPSGGSGNTASSLASGLYSVQVSDGMCYKTTTIQINQPPPVALTASPVSSVSCFGGSNGSATSSGSGGTGAITYNWSPSGGTSANASGLSAGVYNVAITDANGCTTNSNVTIAQPPAVAIAPAPTGSISCFGGSNGSAAANASGGVGGFTYNWTPSGGTAATASGLSVGVYTVSIADANGCPKTGTVQIIQPPVLTISSAVTATVTCFGLSNGSASSSAAGGMGAYTYVWSPSGGSAANASGLAANNYTVKVTDANGCTATSSLQINQPPLLTISATQVNSVSCFSGSNGSASGTASGGLGAYTYVWTPSSQTTSLAINLTASIYSVTVTDINNCAKTATTQVIQPTQVTSSAAQIASVSCAGGSNGSAQATPGGGMGSYTYTWQPSGGNAATASNLSAGVYTVQVQDINNCPSTATAQIVQPSGVSISAAQVSSVTCKGFSNGVAGASASGGVGGYTYTWTPTGATTATDTGLPAGFYTVNIADANGCSISKTVQIIEPSQVTVSAAQITSVLCNGGTNGVAQATASGGVGGYTYAWLPSGGSAAIANGLGANTYTVNIADANSCTATAQATIIEPTSVSLSVAGTNSVLCFNGNTGGASVNASGGVGGYVYTWAPSGGTAASATGLNANTYTVNMHDANNCTTSTTLVIIQPTQLVIAASGTSVNCNGYSNGSTSATVTGGMGGYTYTWSPGGVASANNPNIPAGTYTVNANDVNACSIQTVITITQPSSVTITATNNYTSCYGSNSVVAASASGGNGAPYTYAWSNLSFTGAGPNAVSNITANIVYTVTAFDANGCPTQTLTINITALPPLLAQGNQNTVCDGLSGALSVNVTSPGNGGGYTYSWSNGYTSSNNTGIVVGHYPTQPNIYTVTVSDGCSIPAVTQVTMNVNPSPTGHFISNMRNGCVPLNTNLTAISNNPTTDTYSWNLGNGQTASYSSGPVSYTNVGVYSVTLQITSQYGCIRDTVAQNYFESYPQPTAIFNPDKYTVSILDPLVQFNNSSINAVSYMWDFGDGSVNGNPQATQVNPQYVYNNAGTYTVFLTATSSHGCVNSTWQVIVVEPDYEIYIPNAFTPNGDGVNDTFYPKGVGLSSNDYQLTIFDRWGEHIFNSNALNIGWDGTAKDGKTMAKDDVYTYQLQVKDLKGKIHEYTGHVTLLR
ncbi:MAG: gliding motility-associated C-terminal domain-containing protein [Bacteroidetes bacterium]|nr:gliding motility-associated C-terminal domain-containing protein [Bacteroidota bacterium]